MTAVSDDTGDTKQFQRALTLAAKIITYLVYIYVLIVEIILLLGFFLLLFGANPSSSFVEWVYRSLDRVMRPFRGIFQPIELGQTGNDVPSVFEPSVVFAMIIYGILALLLSSLIGWLTGRIERIDRENAMLRQEQRYEDARDEAQLYGGGVTAPGAPSRPVPPATEQRPVPPATEERAVPSATDSRPVPPATGSTGQGNPPPPPPPSS